MSRWAVKLSNTDGERPAAGAVHSEFTDSSGFSQSSRNATEITSQQRKPLKRRVGIIDTSVWIMSVVSVSLWIQQKLSDPLQTTCTCRLTECIEEELFICHITNYTEYNQQWNVFAVFNPSKCTHTWSSGHTHTHTHRCCGVRGAVGGSVPCSRVSPQSWTIPAGAEIRTHNLGLQVQRSIH